MPATPGWGTKIEHYDEQGRLKPDPGLQQAPAPAPRETWFGRDRSYRHYVEAAGNNPSLNNPETGQPYTPDEWKALRERQTLDQRKAQNTQIEYTPTSKDYAVKNANP